MLRKCENVFHSIEDYSYFQLIWPPPLLSCSRASPQTCSIKETLSILPRLWALLFCPHENCKTKASAKLEGWKATGVPPITGDHLSRCVLANDGAEGFVGFLNIGEVLQTKLCTSSTVCSSEHYRQHHRELDVAVLLCVLFCVPPRPPGPHGRACQDLFEEEKAKTSHQGANHSKESNVSFILDPRIRRTAKSEANSVHATVVLCRVAGERRDGIAIATFAPTVTAFHADFRCCGFYVSSISDQHGLM